MKYLIRITFITFIFLLFSCKSAAERSIEKLQAFTYELETNSSKFTDKEWDKAIAEYDEITDEISEKTYDDNQLKEIGRLKGKCYAIITKRKVKKAGSAINEAAMEVGGAIGGFFDGLTNDDEEEEKE